MTYHPDDYLPVQPLLAYLASVGGPCEALNRAGLLYRDPQRKRLEKNLDRARANGRILAVTADDWIVTVLGVHPATVYGRTWEVATDGRRAS